MDLFVDLKVPAVGGSQWTTAERQREEKSLCGNDLQTLVDFCGSPQNDAVERVKGIEPSSVAWEATALPLSYTRKKRVKSMPGARSHANGAPFTERLRHSVPRLCPSGAHFFRSGLRSRSISLRALFDAEACIAL